MLHEIGVPEKRGPFRLNGWYVNFGAAARWGPAYLPGGATWRDQPTSAAPGVKAIRYYRACTTIEGSDILERLALRNAKPVPI